MTTANKENSQQTLRKRAKNYTAEEEVLLVDLVEAHKNCIENKKSDAVVWKQKEEAWREIEDEFAATSGTHRHWKTLRDKYETIKRRSKGEMAEQKLETYRTGGGVASTKVSMVSAKIASMLGDSATGLQNMYDSDSVDAANKMVFESCIEIVEENQMTNEERFRDDRFYEPKRPGVTPAKDRHLSNATGGAEYTEPAPYPIGRAAKSTTNEEFSKASDSMQETNDWSCWKPSTLKERKSKELVVGAKRKRNIEEEKIELVILQQTFYRDENTRAQEKHEQELQCLKFKNEEELKYLKYKNELLKLELAEKNENVANFNFKV